MQNLLINSLLGKLRSQNPQAYQELVSLMNSGKSPNQVLNELLSSGKINQQQINQAQQLANQYTNGQNNKPKRF